MCFIDDVLYMMLSFADLLPSCCCCCCFFNLSAAGSQQETSVFSYLFFVGNNVVISKIAVKLGKFGKFREINQWILSFISQLRFFPVVYILVTI